MLPRYRFSTGGGAGSPIESRAAYVPELLAIRVWLPVLGSARPVGYYVRKDNKNFFQP